MTEPSFVSIAAYDWVVTHAGNVLHQLGALDDPAKVEDQWGGSGRTTCGLWSEWLSLPGVFSRMGAQRCKRCCARANFPQGVGSPKNAPAWEYRVVSITREDPLGHHEQSYELIEAYYRNRDDTDIVMWTAPEDTRPQGDTLLDLRADLQRMLTACDKPVLIEEELPDD